MAFVRWLIDDLDKYLLTYTLRCNLFCSRKHAWKTFKNVHYRGIANCM